MTYEEVKAQFNTVIVETGSYLTMVQRLDDVRYCRWEGQSEDGRKYSKYTGKQVFPWEGASDIKPYFVDDLIADDVDLLRTADRSAHMQVLGTAGSNDETARAATAVLDYVQRMWLSEELERERDLAANWRQHYGSSVLGIDWLIELDSEQVTVTVQDLMQIAGQDQDFGAMLQFVMQNLQGGNSQGFSQKDQQAFAQKFAQYFPEANPQAALQQLMSQGQFQFNRPYTRTDRPCVTAYRTFQDVFFHRSTSHIQKAPWVVRRDVLSLPMVEDRSKLEQWDPEFTEYIIKSAGSSWMWSSFSRGETLTRFGTRMYTDEMDRYCEVYYGFYRGTDQEAAAEKQNPTGGRPQEPEPGNRQTQVVIFHPGTDTIGRTLPLPYAHGFYPFILCRRENRSRSAFESRGIGDIADSAQFEVKLQRDSRNDRTSFATIPPLMVPLGRGKQQYKLGPASQLGVMRPGELSWLPPPPLDQTTFETENSVKRDVYNFLGKSFDGVDPNKVLRKQQRLINSWLDEQRAVMLQIFQLCLQFLPIEKWQQISGNQSFQLPIGQRDFIQNNMMLILEFDARDLNMEYLEQKLQLINTMLVPTDAAGVIDRAGLTQYAMQALDPAGARLIRPQGQATQAEITEEQGALGQIVTGVTPPIPGGGTNPQLRLQVIQSTLQAPDFQNFIKANPLAQQRLQERIKSFQFAIQQQQNAQVGRIGVPPSPVQSLGAPQGPPAGAS